MSNVWLISDTHYGHKMLVEQGHRPADFEHRMFLGLANVMRPGDTVIHLGDWIMHAGSVEHATNVLKWMNESVGPKGRTVFVRGNHDKSSIVKYLGVGWGSVSDGFMWRMYGKKLYFTHKPKQNITYTDDSTGEERRLFDLNIHGHLHGANHHGTVNDPFHAEISMELLDYTPISLEKLVQLGGTPQRDASGKLTVRASI